MTNRARTTRLLCGLALAVGLSTAGCTCEDRPEASIELSAQGKSVTWTTAKLAEFSRTQVAVDDHTYEGVALADLLQASGIESGSEVEVVLEGSDGYRQTISSERLWQPGVIIADSDRGQALQKDGPLRMVVEGSPGLSVRNLVRLQVQ